MNAWMGWIRIEQFIKFNKLFFAHLKTYLPTIQFFVLNCLPMNAR
jgi:hypothetical protein